MSDIKILRDDELSPDFINVKGFWLEDDSLIFTGDFTGDGQDFNNVKTLTLKSNGSHYVMKSCTYIGNDIHDVEVVYTVIRGRLAKKQCD